MVDACVTCTDNTKNNCTLETNVNIATRQVRKAQRQVQRLQHFILCAVWDKTSNGLASDRIIYKISTPLDAPGLVPAVPGGPQQVHGGPTHCVPIRLGPLHVPDDVADGESATEARMDEVTAAAMRTASSLAAHPPMTTSATLMAEPRSPVLHRGQHVQEGICEEFGSRALVLRGSRYVGCACCWDRLINQQKAVSFPYSLRGMDSSLRGASCVAPSERRMQDDWISHANGLVSSDATQDAVIRWSRP